MGKDNRIDVHISADHRIRPCHTEMNERGFENGKRDPSPDSPPSPALRPTSSEYIRFDRMVEEIPIITDSRKRSPSAAGSHRLYYNGTPRVKYSCNCSKQCSILSWVTPAPARQSHKPSNKIYRRRCKTCQLIGFGTLGELYSKEGGMLRAM